MKMREIVCTVVNGVGDLFHNILLDKLMKYGLNNWTVRLTENCLMKYQAQRVVISSARSIWRFVTSGVPVREQQGPAALRDWEPGAKQKDTACRAGTPPTGAQFSSTSSKRPEQAWVQQL